MEKTIKIVLGIFVAVRGRLHRELGNVIGPFLFRAITVVCNALDAVPDLGTAVRLHGPFDHALVVVDEQP